MKKTNIIFSALSMTLSGVLVLSSCGKKEDKGDEKGSVDFKPSVNVMVVTDQYVPDTRQYTANVEAYKSNNISPATPNRIKTIRADVGDKVSQGQVLVTLDDANLAQLETNLNLLQTQYDRAVNLLNIGSGTQASVDNAKTQLDAMRTQVKNVKENTILVSPMTGVVTARNYDPGDMTGAQPVLTVGQISPNVKVVIDITENDMAKVKKGMPATIKFDAFPEEEFTGIISRIYPNVNASTRTFQAEVEVVNKDTKLFPGMFARVTMDMGGSDMVMVPDRAVVKQTGAGNQYVYVYRDGKVKFSKVETGRQIGDSYPIISGVEVGDTVIVAGQNQLANDVSVVINTVITNTNSQE